MIIEDYMPDTVEYRKLWLRKRRQQQQQQHRRIVVLLPTERRLEKAVKFLRKRAVPIEKIAKVVAARNEVPTVVNPKRVMAPLCKVGTLKSIK